MTKIYFEIPNSNGDLIKGDLRIPFLQIKTPLIIFSHGFKGFRNWSFIPFVCESFTEHGFLSVNFDFSLNGITDDVHQVYDSEIFRKNKVSVEVDDLSTLIENISGSKLEIKEFYDIWNGEIYLAGHSLGGAVSILTANKYSNIKKMSLWASISNLDRNTQRQKELWKNKGYTDIIISSTGQKLQLDYAYIEDKDKSFPEGAILKAISKNKIPYQVIHPVNDMTVNIREAYQLVQKDNNIIKSELIVIEKAGHTFNCRHPFDGQSTAALEKVLESAIMFFES